MTSAPTGSPRRRSDRAIASRSDERYEAVSEIRSDGSTRHGWSRTTIQDSDETVTFAVDYCGFLIDAIGTTADRSVTFSFEYPDQLSPLTPPANLCPSQRCPDLPQE